MNEVYCHGNFIIRVPFKCVCFNWNDFYRCIRLWFNIFITIRSSSMLLETNHILNRSIPFFSVAIARASIVIINHVPMAMSITWNVVQSLLVTFDGICVVMRPRTGTVHRWKTQKLYGHKKCYRNLLLWSKLFDLIIKSACVRLRNGHSHEREKKERRSGSFIICGRSRYKTRRAL